jgi:hypothetical protein
MKRSIGLTPVSADNPRESLLSSALNLRNGGLYLPRLEKDAKKTDSLFVKLLFGRLLGSDHFGTGRANRPPQLLYLGLIQRSLY